MRKPVKAKVGPWVFRIDWANDDLLDAHGGDGLCEATKLVITVRSTLVEGVQRTILMHELLHACVAFGDETVIKDEESAVDRIAVPLVAMLHDNPPLAAWLMRTD